MKYDNSIRCITDDVNGIVHFANRYFTNIGLVNKNTIMTLETPVLFYSNNPAGGEVSAKSIGAFTYFNYNPDIRSISKIGRFCSFAQNIVAGVGGHSTTALSHHQMFELPQVWAKSFWDYDELWIRQNAVENLEKEPKRKEIGEIGNDVWIGCNSVILKGVKIGDGAIIAAGSMVTKDVPPYSIVGGVPDKIIRKRFPDEIIERLLKAKWWDYGPNVLKELQISEPMKCIDELEQRIANGFPLYKPDKFEFDCQKETITKIYAESGQRELVYELKRKG